MRIELDVKELRAKGLEIGIAGASGNPTQTTPSQVYIELYNGAVLVHVWNGSEDPVSVAIPLLK